MEYGSGPNKRTPVGYSVCERRAQEKPRYSTYHRDNPGSCGKQEPKNTLTNRKHIRGLREPCYQELPPPHLLPEEMCKTTHASATTAETEQTKKHDENQCDVGGGHDNEGIFVALHVG